MFRNHDNDANLFLSISAQSRLETHTNALAAVIFYSEMTGRTADNKSFLPSRKTTHAYSFNCY